MDTDEELEPYYYEGLWFPKWQLRIFEKGHIDEYLNKVYGTVAPTTPRNDPPMKD